MSYDFEKVKYTVNSVKEYNPIVIYNISKGLTTGKTDSAIAKLVKAVDDYLYYSLLKQVNPSDIWWGLLEELKDRLSDSKWTLHQSKNYIYDFRINEEPKKVELKQEIKTNIFGL